MPTDVGRVETAFKGPAANFFAGGPGRAVCDNRRPMPVFLILSACPDADTAQRLARILVEERLAACVSLLPGGVSTYRWQGRVEQATEVHLLAKTPADRRDALMARLAELHPYELPEILAVETAAGLPAYLDWVTAETRTDASPE